MKENPTIKFKHEIKNQETGQTYLTLIYDGKDSYFQGDLLKISKESLIESKSGFEKVIKSSQESISKEKDKMSSEEFDSFLEQSNVLSDTVISFYNYLIYVSKLNGRINADKADISLQKTINYIENNNALDIQIKYMLIEKAEQKLGKFDYSALENKVKKGQNNIFSKIKWFFYNRKTDKNTDEEAFLKDLALSKEEYDKLENKYGSGSLALAFEDGLTDLDDNLFCYAEVISSILSSDICTEEYKKQANSGLSEYLREVHNELSSAMQKRFNDFEEHI
jgi:hypothetical protein